MNNNLKTTLELININFTKHLLDTIFNIVDLSTALQTHFAEMAEAKAKAIKADAKKGKDKEKAKEKDAKRERGAIERADVTFFPFVLRNKTGKNLQFWFKKVRIHE